MINDPKLRWKIEKRKGIFRIPLVESVVRMMRTSLIILLLLSFGKVEALTLAELQKSFQVNRLKIEDAGATKHVALGQKYTAALEKTGKKFQKAGRLDDTLAIKGEIALVKSQTWPLPPLDKEAPFDLLSARKLYLKSYLMIQRETGKKLMASIGTMDKLLQKQVVSLTKANDLEGAQAAKKFWDDLNNDPKIKEYRALLERVRSDGSSSVGMRIRRPGDNLEVLALYDSSGKISANSKIENVVEISGGKNEKGETKAQTLGEFIGAKGYEVDPYIAIDKTFDDRTLDPINATSLETQFLKEDEGEKGVRLVSIVKPVNTHVSLGNCLPGLSEKGTYVVSARYFVPRTNAALKGIRFLQGVGVARPGSESQEIGKWDTLTFTATSSHELRNLLLYFVLDPKANKVQKAGDYVTLASVSVKHTAFSAYMVERFDRNGAVVESNLASGEQKQIAENGVVLIQE